MNLSRNWLNEFVDLHDITDKQFNDEMTLSGSKVETIERLDESLKNVVAGKILSMEKHPDSLLFERTLGRPGRSRCRSSPVRGTSTSAIWCPRRCTSPCCPAA